MSLTKRTRIRRNARWLLRLTVLKQKLTQMLGFITFSPTYMLYLLLTGCGTEMITFEEAKNQKYVVTVENINFDVPVLFHPIESKKAEEKWPMPNPERKTVDAIRIVALLPDMESYNEKTASDFKVAGWGKKVSIMMTHYRVNWPYYFEGAYKRLIKLPENPLLPGMFHFRDPMADMQDSYLSHDQPVRYLTEIRCDNPQLDPHPSISPSCHVTTIYRDQFQLDYSFSLNYLENWTDIDRKVKALFDNFVVNP